MKREGLESHKTKEIAKETNHPEEGPHIDDLSAEELLAWIKANEPAFWRITKDQIRVCQDCEYRYMCMDRRIPEPVPNGDDYYHQSSCGYNPYLGLWETEEGFEPAPYLGRTESKG